jgi:hypothetical protein
MKELETLRDRFALELMPQLGVSPIQIYKAFGKGTPGLGMQGRIVEQMALAGLELLVPGIPTGIEIAA